MKQLSFEWFDDLHSIWSLMLSGGPIDEIDKVIRWGDTGRLRLSSNKRWESVWDEIALISEEVFKENE